MKDYDMGGINIINAANLLTKDEIDKIFVRNDSSFVFKIATTAASQVFTIPCQDIGVFNATISWGDGTTSTITTYNSAALAHTYTAIDTYLISISGSFPNIYFNNSGSKLLVKSVEQLGDVGWMSFYKAFYGCANMTSFNIGLCNTSVATNMSYMLAGCIGLTSVDLSTLKTDSVTDMSFMFSGCTKLVSLNISNFNTINVTNMQLMFDNCEVLTALNFSSFKTTNVTSMTYMFYNCKSLVSLNLNNFNTSKVTDMKYMFVGCLKIVSLDLSNFNTSAVTDMSLMFGGCLLLTSVIGIETFNVANVTVLTNFITGGKITTAQYDALLINWDAQVVKPSLIVNFGGSKYTSDSAAATARAHLISSDLWTITDGGTA